MIILKNILFYLFFVLSLVLHELAHAFMAYKKGDHSNQIKKRLTLNPLVHMDIWGSALLPLMFILSNSGFIIGWAKPVTVNGNVLKNPLKDIAFISICGPLANLALATICFIALKVLFAINDINFFVYELLYLFILLNIILFVFNMLPIPPLDGSKIMFYVLPNKYKKPYMKYGSYLMIPIFILILTGMINPLLMSFSKLINSLL